MEVSIAALAVIGFYGVLHGCFEWLLCPRQITVAVVLDRPVDAPELEMLLCEAQRTPWRLRRRRVMLVLPAMLLEGAMGQAGRLQEEYAAVAATYGAVVCVMPPPAPDQ